MMESGGEMVSASMDLLEESLVKKIEVMKKIQLENVRQKELLSDPEHLQLEDFDKTLDTKGEYIDELLRLDEGFQSLFDRVKADVGDRKDQFADQIKRMQDMIQEITGLSASIEAEEHRNKRLAEQYFQISRTQMNQSKQSSAAAFNYYQTMSNYKNVPPQFMDKKN
ncbi:hypothetical protein [Butyrivibrio sp. CB08]|uniref:hypothetical protein n=1 Tax=Butyrivibrio sp. CB08 TaxID=2364879 RepID=UPI0011C22157|nr:hypothetical protein [Butyrivibrio sp. CB08]